MKINIVLGLFIGAYLFTFANAFRLPLPANMPMRRVQWGLNQERAYFQLPKGMTKRELFSMPNLRTQIHEQALEADTLTQPDQENPCKCGECYYCRMQRDVQGNTARLFGFGGYEPYGLPPPPYFEYDMYPDPYYGSYDGYGSYGNYGSSYGGSYGRPYNPYW